MTKKQTQNTPAREPVFDRNVPIPMKGRTQFLDAKRAYLVGQEEFGVSFALRLMAVGESCLMSNWATTSVSYVQQHMGYKFQRELQEDGAVRIWRVE